MFAVLFKPFVYVLSVYFYVSHNLVARPQWLNLAKYREHVFLDLRIKRPFLLFKSEGKKDCLLHENKPVCPSKPNLQQFEIKNQIGT